MRKHINDGRHNEQGHEILSDKAVSLPVRIRRNDALTEQIRAFIRDEVSRSVSGEGYETFDEANDFEVEDDYDPKSPHEMSLEEELDGYQTFDEFRRDVREHILNERKSNAKAGNVGGGNTETGGSVEGGREGNKDATGGSKSDQRSFGGKDDG